MHALVLKPDWDCETCTSTLQVVRGCTDTPTFPFYLGDKAMARCPRRPLLDEPNAFSEVFWLYSNYDRGILPYGPALYDNPHKLVQFFRVIEASKSEAQKERDRKEQRRDAMRQNFEATNTRR